ncbi:MAG: VanZ family protein [Luteolibacter sp.]|uniref:VanZ family protein n=1 Tax=Luteolibacter sp. TaxID=1962973 RepID=UPI0032671E1F
MPRLPRSPKFWLGAFLLWFGVLWLLSSGTHPGIPMPPIDFFDKIEHFGYFFGGAGLLSAWLYRRNPANPNWLAIIVTTVIVMALVGWMDEYHQGFVPGRSGNDLPDWIADFCGASAGALSFKALHRRLR